MKTRADIKGTNAAVTSGIYEYKLGRHEGNYFSEHDALIINDNKEISIQEPNIARGGILTACGIHSHVGNPMNPNNQGTTGSAGCWTVPAILKSDKEAMENYRAKKPKTWKNYNEFIANFKNNPTGKALLIRLPDWRTFWKTLKNKIKNKTNNLCE